MAGEAEQVRPSLARRMWGLAWPRGGWPGTGVRFLRRGRRAAVWPPCPKRSLGTGAKITGDSSRQRGGGPHHACALPSLATLGAESDAPRFHRPELLTPMTPLPSSSALASGLAAKALRRAENADGCAANFGGFPANAKSFAADAAGVAGNPEGSVTKAEGSAPDPEGVAAIGEGFSENGEGFLANGEGFSPSALSVKAAVSSVNPPGVSVDAPVLSVTRFFAANPTPLHH